MTWIRGKFSLFALLFQVALLVLFIIFVKYGPESDAKKQDEPHGSSHAGGDLEDTFPMFVDVHVMIFLGFGFLMTFLQRYGYGAVALNMVIAVLCMQWGTIIQGFFHYEGEDIPITLETLITADFCAAAVLISFGAVLGRTSPLQLLVMAVLEVVVYQLNEWICLEKYHIADIGGSMMIHAFGAYFGLGVSMFLFDRTLRIETYKDKKSSVYHSDLFSMIGTLFLWVCWPSFNSALASGDERYRAIINTYYALCACTLTTYLLSSLVGRGGKMEMEHVQNATLAGAVGVGAMADLQLEPWGAIVVGMSAAVVSVLGFKFMSACLAKTMRVYDTCGVHYLHGLPGVLSGIGSIIMALRASEDNTGYSLYDVYPMRVPKEGSVELFNLTSTSGLDLDPGKGWSADKQAQMQAAGLFTSVGLALVGGIITGLIIRLPIWNRPTSEDLYEDEPWWDIPEEGYPGGRSPSANGYPGGRSPSANGVEMSKI